MQKSIKYFHGSIQIANICQQELNISGAPYASGSHIFQLLKLQLMLHSQVRAKCDLCSDSGKQQRTAVVRREACSVTPSSWLFFIELIFFLVNLQVTACSVNLELCTRWHQLSTQLHEFPQVHTCLNDVWHGEVRPLSCSQGQQISWGLASVTLGWVVVGLGKLVYRSPTSGHFGESRPCLFPLCITVRGEFLQWFMLEEKAMPCSDLILTHVKRQLPLANSKNQILTCLLGIPIQLVSKEPRCFRSVSLKQRLR